MEDQRITMEPTDSSDNSLEGLVREELDHAFTNDRLRLGSVYRCIKRDLSDEEIMQELGLGTIGSIGHARRSIRAIRDGWNPPGLHPAMIAKNDLGRLLREFNFSERVRTVLRDRYEILEANLQQIRESQADEETDDPQNTQDTTSNAAIAGVYVWTIDTYRENEDDRGQVWFRIGCSDDVFQRMREHRAAVKLPEPLVLVRVFSHNSLSPRELESRFHTICSVAVHERARVNNRDREWFRTNLDFLDKYSQDIGCINHVFLSDDA